MANDERVATAGSDFVISRSADQDTYELWRLDPLGEELLAPVEVPEPSLDKSVSLASVGAYMLRWERVESNGKSAYPYQLFRFDPTARNPLASIPTVQTGTWSKRKFWGSVEDFGNPDGAKKDYESSTELTLLSFGNFVLNFIPSCGRGTFRLWNFDPAAKDPLPSKPYFPRGAFETIQLGHQLHPIGNFCLDRVPETGAYRLFSFDPMAKIPIAEPVVQAGTWGSIDASHELVVIGDKILDWVPKDRSYRLWGFDPKREDPLVGPLRSGRLPESFASSTSLLGFQDMVPIDEERAKSVGTIDFMRSRVKHIVYYMIENRSFDHACGWLYEKGDENVHFIGPDRPFDGASEDFYNLDPASNDDKVPLSKFMDGKVNEQFDLDLPVQDPYHDNSDVMRQMFGRDLSAYHRRETPNMEGFVWNNGAHNVMQTYTPDQLPVLNGLAREFAVSDEWFCSMPGGTDVNRAFSVSGSAEQQLNNFQNGSEYANWPDQLHRPSIWKVLWSNGIQDWRIYNSVEWMSFAFTYHLFLQGQIPTVDENSDKYLGSYEQFIQDAKAGQLPAFSFVEPVWIAKTGTTSYHPGADVVPGEIRLNDIYAALKSSPKWEETMLVVTFDEHGGIYDHVPPPYAENPYPNDNVEGFKFDIMGVRIPTIVASPYVQKQTVFRSEEDAKYCSTSFLATLLHWFGVPKARWGLGQRTHHSPTFERVLSCESARKDFCTFSPPNDKSYPKQKASSQNSPVQGMDRLMVPRLLHAVLGGKVPADEVEALSDEILEGASDAHGLHELITKTLQTKK